MSSHDRKNLDDRDWPELQQLCLSCRSVSCDRGWCQRYEEAASRCLETAKVKPHSRGYKIVTWRGRLVTVAELAEVSGLTIKSIYWRLGHGWTTEEAVTVPRGRQPARLRTIGREPGKRRGEKE